MRTAYHAYVVWKRETAEYFFRPIAYVVLTVFAVAAGGQFIATATLSRTAQMRPVFEFIGVLAIFFAPLITMRLYAEERRDGTLESLLSLPARPSAIVLGKFLASMTFYLVLLSPTFVYVYYLYKYGNPDPDTGAIVIGYIGVCLSGATYLAIGGLASSLTRDQIIAATTAMVLLLMLYWVVPQLGEALPAAYKPVIRYFSFSRQNGEFFKGVIDTRAVVMNLSLTALFLYLTARVLKDLK